MVLIACANAAAALAANAGGVFPQLDVIAQLAPLLMEEAHVLAERLGHRDQRGAA